MQKSFRSKFFASQYRKISLGNTSVYQKISCSKKFYASERGGGVSSFFVENFLSHSTDKIRRKTLLFRKNSGIEKFQAKEGGSFTVLSKFFLSHRNETKSFVKEPFCFPEIFWYRKKIMDKRGLITIFSRNFYVSQC